MNTNLARIDETEGEFLPRAAELFDELHNSPRARALFAVETGEMSLEQLLEDILEVPVKYPHIKAQILSYSGSGFWVAGRVAVQLRHAGVADDEVERFLDLATSGDMNRLLRVCTAWVSVE